MSNKSKKLKEKIAKKEKELASLQKKVKEKKIELAGLSYDLGQLTLEEV